MANRPNYAVEANNGSQNHAPKSLPDLWVFDLPIMKQKGSRQPYSDCGRENRLIPHLKPASTLRN